MEVSDPEFDIDERVENNSSGNWNQIFSGSLANIGSWHPPADPRA
jgi:hypothetical protein